MRTGSASVRDGLAAAVEQGPAPHIRSGQAIDLPAINGVVERAVMSWRLPERVKRLALPSYRYRVQDLRHQRLLVAELPEIGIAGVAALEEADPRELPCACTGLLLHGLYVDPTWQGRGIGTRLLQAACAACRESGHHGLLIKAQPDAAAFFEARGMLRLAVKDPERDYPYRYWKAVHDDALTAAAGEA